VTPCIPSCVTCWWLCHVMCWWLHVFRRVLRVGDYAMWCVGDSVYSVMCYVLVTMPCDVLVTACIPSCVTCWWLYHVMCWWLRVFRRVLRVGDCAMWCVGDCMYSVVCYVLVSVACDVLVTPCIPSCVTCWWLCHVMCRWLRVFRRVLRVGDCVGVDQVSNVVSSSVLLQARWTTALQVSFTPH